MIKIRSREEMDEFSLYCIVEGDTFTMPLAREEYILDVTTELQKNEQVGPGSGWSVAPPALAAGRAHTRNQHAASKLI